MQPDFWLERWTRGETGFHLPTVNPHLTRHWPTLGLARGARVLVPLAGKSVDLLWLRAAGYDVIAVELSPLAADAVFDALGETPTRRRRGACEELCVPGLSFLIGDFFATTVGDLGLIDASYDRAALVALPAASRPAYARHLAALLPAGARGLLIGFEYPQAELAGPPFAVDENEVRALFGASHAIAVLDCVDILDQEPRFRARGLSRLHERVYALNRR